MSEEKFLTKRKFSLEIEFYVNRNNVSYLDAIVVLCEKMSYDLRDVKPLINDRIKEKLRLEAMQLNLISDRKLNKLPI